MRSFSETFPRPGLRANQIVRRSPTELLSQQLPQHTSLFPPARSVMSSRAQPSQRRGEVERPETLYIQAALRSLDSVPLSLPFAGDDRMMVRRTPGVICHTAFSARIWRRKPVCRCFNHRRDGVGCPWRRACGRKSRKKKSLHEVKAQTIDKPWGCIEGAVAPSIVIRRRRHVRRRGAAESRFLYQFAAVK